MQSAISARAEADDPGVATQIREDHIGMYRRDQQFVSDHRQQIIDAATAGLHAG